MRLLVHGGSQFIVRYQHGEWDIDTAVLEDKFGLPSNDWAFGVGILNDTAIVILRRRTLGTANRSYPFTILFGPDNELWERFGWNGARVIQALLSDENPFQEKLLSSPETFTRNDVASMGLGLFPQNGERSDFDPVVAMIVGGTFESQVFSANLSSETPYPSIGEMSDMLHSVPECLRCGAGWLIGGNQIIARSLGVGIVFNSQRLEDVEISRAPSIEDCGFALLRDWRIVEGHFKRSPTLEKFSRVPVWNWKERLRTDPVEFKVAITDLADRIRSNDLSGDPRWFAGAEVPHSATLFMAEHREWSLSLAQKPSRPLSFEQTEFLLDAYNKGEINIDQIPTKQLDHNAFGEWLVARRTPPSISEIKVKLHDDQLQWVCIGLLNAEQQPERIPELFGTLWSELPTGSASFLEEFANAAVLQAGTNWKIWEPYLSREPFESRIKPRISNIARDLVIKQVGHWEITYLEWADDLGANWLAGAVNNQLLNRVVEIAFERANSESQGKSRGWLLSIVDSPVRKRIDLDLKKKVAQLFPDKGWKRFSCLVQILGVEPPEKVSRVKDADERKALTAELIEIAEACSDELLLERKKLLKEFLGNLPSQIDERIAEISTQVAEVDDIAERLSQHEKSVHDLALEADRLAELIASFTRDVYSTASNPETLRLLVSEFWKLSEPGWNRIFPLLPIEFRAEILRYLKRNDPDRTAEFVRERFELALNQSDHGRFDNALWETILFSREGAELRRLLHGSSSRRKIQLKLRDLIDDSSTPSWRLRPEVIGFSASDVNHISFFRRVWRRLRAFLRFFGDDPGADVEDDSSKSTQSRQ